jgi:predicted DNA-binding ribbon-helix-helix protein
MRKDQKRSLTVAGHRTSISLEPEFWEALTAHARKQGKSISTLVANIDQQRQSRNLSSAIRVFLLNSLRAEPHD